jgi:hypothetical protein
MFKRKLRRLKKEYENSDALTAALLQSKIRLHALGKLRKRQIRETIRKKYPGYVLWREISEEIDDELEILEERRIKKKFFVR